MRPPLLEAADLVVEFPVRRGLREWARRTEPRVARALDGVSVEVGRGEIVALVGESGCGKTTAANAMLRLQTVSGGSVYFEGVDIAGLKGSALRQFRRGAQIVYQDPYESLDSRFTVERIIAEPLLIHGIGSSRSERAALVLEALERVGLTPPEQFLTRYPHQLSGGQRQRVAIASALILRPKLLIADEPVSMLDVSVRAGILRLLAELRETSDMSVVMITHDLSTVGHFADRVYVLYAGRIVEAGPSRQVLRQPTHPYTRALVDVAPRRRPTDISKRTLLAGEAPDLLALPAGCRFHPRCPIVEEQCAHIDPPLLEHRPDQLSACLLVEPIVGAGVELSASVVRGEREAAREPTHDGD